MVRREAARGIVADNLLTAGTNSRTIEYQFGHGERRPIVAPSAGPPLGRSTRWGGLFTVLMCADCQAARRVESASHGLLAEATHFRGSENGSKPVGLLELVTRQNGTRQR